MREKDSAQGKQPAAEFMFSGIKRVSNLHHFCTGSDSVRPGSTPLKFWVTFGSHPTKRRKTILHDMLWFITQNGMFRYISKRNNTILYGITLSHNPEVVGSSPASATKIIPDFDMKSGIFLTF